MNLTNAIEEMVNERDWVTFAEISRLEGFTAETGKGGMTLTIKGGRKRERILWSNMTQEGSDAILQLLDEHRITLAPAQMLSYLADGSVISHKDWLPVCFRPKSECNYSGANGWLCYDPTKDKAKKRRGRK